MDATGTELFQPWNDAVLIKYFKTIGTVTIATTDSF